MHGTELSSDGLPLVSGPRDEVPAGGHDETCGIDGQVLHAAADVFVECIEGKFSRKTNSCRGLIVESTERT